MNKQFTFRGMEHSNILQEYANQQLEKIEKLLLHEKEPIYLHIILTAERTHHHHKVEFQISSPNFNLNAHDEGPDIYVAVTKACDRMYHQLTEEKRKHVAARHTGIKRE